jgi:hypothetical protein
VENQNFKKIVMLTQEQIKLIIESLEDLQVCLSNQSLGNLYTEQLELLEYLKQLKN